MPKPNVPLGHMAVKGTCHGQPLRLIVIGKVNTTVIGKNAGVGHFGRIFTPRSRRLNIWLNVMRLYQFEGLL
jgi:hypothetical protein